MPGFQVDFCVKNEVDLLEALDAYRSGLFAQVLASLACRRGMR